MTSASHIALQFGVSGFGLIICAAVSAALSPLKLAARGKDGVS